MRKREMKKNILVALLLILVMACGNNSIKEYSSLEKALISILEQKDEKKVTNLLEKAIKNKNEAAYKLAYIYFGNDGIKFFDKYLGKSKGNAEFYKGLLLQTTDASEKEIIDIFEKSAENGKEKAYYVLGSIYQDKLEFSKAMEYFEKGKNKGEIYSIYSYNYLKNLQRDYKKVEQLNEKYYDKTITKNEKKELGKLVLEKFSNYEKAYEILKEFIPENYPPALYVKAKMLENENQKTEAIKIYNNLYFEYDYFLGGFEIAYNLVGEKNFELAMRVLEEMDVDNSLINGYRGFVYQNLNDNSKAEFYYLKAVKENDIDIMMYLGRFYEKQNNLKKAKDIYEKAYNLGSIRAGYSLAEILEKLKKDKKVKTIKSNKDAKKILERLAKSEDEDSIIELSFYYSDKDKRVRDINLLAAATSFNSTALHNLGVYYYNKKNEKKSKIYLRAAKEYGYQLETEFENYINKK